MENYLYFLKSAQLLNNIPDVKKYVKPNDILQHLPYIKEFGKMEFHHVKLKSLELHYNDGIEICFIHKGKYHWKIEDRNFVLYPGDCFFTYPWQIHGSPKGFIDLGVISWIIISPKRFNKEKGLKLGSWSQIPDKNQKEVSQAFLRNTRQYFSNNSVGLLFEKIHSEIKNHHFGYKEIINNTIDEIFIQITRSISNGYNNTPCKGNTCVGILEQKLKNDLSYKWTLSEMSEILDIGQTSLNLLLKRETGFTPAQFLMDMRINEAKRQLQQSSQKITEIALNCGFCSLQHFSSTFLRITGYKPKEFRAGNHN
jgi:AraC-like DNA-binding protein